MFGHFYHNTVRKLVVAFGTLFNEIDVKRYNADDSSKRQYECHWVTVPKKSS